MDAQLADVSLPSRLADQDEGISQEELALAARNHGIMLEALRYDVTPIGLHYLLTHYDMPALDPATWRLAVTGAVSRRLELTLDELRSRPARTVRVTMECAGNGRARMHPRPISQPWLVEAVGTAEWTGVPLRDVLESAGVRPSAAEVVFTGADHGVERGVEQDYQRGLPLDEALGEEVLLAYEMNGQPLPPQHGHPVRLVVPGWYGMTNVKWLQEISVVEEPFRGFQHRAYRYRQSPDDPGEPATRMVPRSLIEPPGFPDFMSRARVVRPGELELRGRAWSGHAPIDRVEVSTDGGRNWAEAEVDADRPRWSWRGWRSRWRAEPGSHVLAARATDADGNVQPTGQSWNRGGFGNNLVHTVPVSCIPE